MVVERRDSEAIGVHEAGSVDSDTIKFVFRKAGPKALSDLNFDLNLSVDNR